ncbi:hypothetical protein ACOME3_004022 [Neoechinorhynchus agilis]
MDRSALVFDNNNTGINLPQLGTDDQPAARPSGMSDDPPRRAKGKWLFWSVFSSFLISGCGLTWAGSLLNLAEKRKAFIQVRALTQMVTTLLGLKGNLEMTLASRLSTRANMGDLDIPNRASVVIVGNVILIQVQSIVVTLTGCSIIIVREFFTSPTYNFPFLFVANSCISAACISGFIISLLIVAIIYVAFKKKFDPDNIASPVASALEYWSHLCILSAIGASLGLWIYFTRMNEYVKDTLYNGWTPLFIAMAISLLAGFFLDISVKEYPMIAIWQPLLNGTGGNLVSIQASRYGTCLHKLAKRMEEAHGIVESLVTDENEGQIDHLQRQSMLYAKSTSRAALREVDISRILIASIIPGQMVLLVLVYLLNHKIYSFSATLILLYIVASLVQTAILLALAFFITPIVWHYQSNPDNMCIPILTAFGDLLGTMFLWMIYALLRPTRGTMNNVTELGSLN